MTQWTFREDRVSLVHVHFFRAREREEEKERYKSEVRVRKMGKAKRRELSDTRDATIACGMCEINDAAQLGVINRGIIMVAIINIASPARDNRSRQTMRLRSQ